MAVSLASAGCSTNDVLLLAIAHPFEPSMSRTIITASRA
jgi:hypothetical protein